MPTFPPSEHLGHARNIGRVLFSLKFYGEGEGAAVILGPVPENTGRPRPVSEFYREAAVSPDDARVKLRSAMRQLGLYPE
jgi:hypothetical protein